MKWCRLAQISLLKAIKRYEKAENCILWLFHIPIFSRWVPRTYSLDHAKTMQNRFSSLLEHMINRNVFVRLLDHSWTLNRKTGIKCFDINCAARLVIVVAYRVCMARKPVPRLCYCTSVSNSISLQGGLKQKATVNAGLMCLCPFF